MLHPNCNGNKFWCVTFGGDWNLQNRWNKITDVNANVMLKTPFLLLIYHLNLFPYYFKPKSMFSQFSILAFSHSSLNAWPLYCKCPLFPLLHVFIYSYTLFLPRIDCIYFTLNFFDVYHLTCTFFKSISITVKESDSDTIIMVIVLVAGVGGVFILFALMALCYR